MNAESLVRDFSGKKPDDILKEAKAFFQLPVIPEYLPSETLLASIYRALGYGDMRDFWISRNGKELAKLLSQNGGVPQATFSPDEIQRLLRDVLLVPEDPKQKRSQKYADFFFLAPIVPATALFSNPIRLNKNINSSGGNPWPVETLFKLLVSYAAHNDDDAANLWNRLFLSLSVHDNEEEDFFARIVQRLLESCATALVETFPDSVERLPCWRKTENDVVQKGKHYLSSIDRTVFSDVGPLDEIREGLLAVLALKPRFSRWQWITMLDAQLRISVMSFVLWLLDLHHVARTAINHYAIQGIGMVDDSPDVMFRRFYGDNHLQDVFCYGEGFAKSQKQIVSGYARDLVTIAFFLETARKLNPEKFRSLNWSTVAGFMNSLLAYRYEFSKPDVQKAFRDGIVKIVDERSDDMTPRKGRLKHLLEFLAVLRQKPVVESQSDFIRYDQSYFARKKGSYASSPFIVDMGSVSCFVSAYCSARGRRVFPVTDLERHLEKFYITVRKAHREMFVNQLKGLGLTMDSPDAGGGLMILNPFV